jgi:hypothetical protein
MVPKSFSAGITNRTREPPSYGNFAADDSRRKGALIGRRPSDFLLGEKPRGIDRWRRQLKRVSELKRELSRTYLNWNPAATDRYA